MDVQKHAMKDHHLEEPTPVDCDDDLLCIGLATVGAVHADAANLIDMADLRELMSPKSDDLFAPRLL